MCISGVKATFKMTKFRRKGAACGGLGWTILISTLVPLSFAQTQVPPGALPTSTSDASTSSRPIGPMAFFINTSAYVVVQDDLLKPNYQEQHFGFRWGGNIMHALTDPVFQQWIITLCSMKPSIECKSEAGSSWQREVMLWLIFTSFLFRSNLLAEAAAFLSFSSLNLACNHHHFEITVRVHLFEAESSSYVWKSHLHFQIIWFCKSSRKKMNIIHHTYTFLTFESTVQSSSGAPLLLNSLATITRLWLINLKCGVICYHQTIF